MALREPTSSSLSQTQPQPLPLRQPLTGASSLPASLAPGCFSAAARADASSPGAEGPVHRPRANAAARADNANAPRNHFTTHLPRGAFPIWLRDRFGLEHETRRIVSVPG